MMKDDYNRSKWHQLSKKIIETPPVTCVGPPTMVQFDKILYIKIPVNSLFIRLLKSIDNDILDIFRHRPINTYMSKIRHFYEDDKGFCLCPMICSNSKLAQIPTYCYSGNIIKLRLELSLDYDIESYYKHTVNLTIIDITDKSFFPCDASKSPTYDMTDE